MTPENTIKPEDDSDILEELSGGSATLLPRISGMSDVGVGEKQRRHKDEDEPLERLSKSKRWTPGPSSPQPDAESMEPKSAAPLKGGGED